MAEVVANWWGGLSDLHKGLSVIISTAVGTAAVVIGLIQFWGVPARVSANEVTLRQQAEEIRDMKNLMTDLRSGQALQTCLLLADANGTNPLECVR